MSSTNDGPISERSPLDGDTISPTSGDTATKPRPRKRSRDVGGLMLAVFVGGFLFHHGTVGSGMQTRTVLEILATVPRNV